MGSGRDLEKDSTLENLAAVTKVVVGLVDPVGAGRSEDIEIERVLEGPSFMRQVRGNAKNFAGVDDDLFAIDGEFQCAFEDVSELLVVVMMKRDVAAFFEEDASEHNLLTVNHFAVDERIEMFALDLAPGDVFRFWAG